MDNEFTFVLERIHKSLFCHVGHIFRSQKLGGERVILKNRFQLTE